jgi:hypothetical protein
MIDSLVTLSYLLDLDDTDNPFLFFSLLRDLFLCFALCSPTASFFPLIGLLVIPGYLFDLEDCEELLFVFSLLG